MTKRMGRPPTQESQQRRITVHACCTADEKRSFELMAAEKGLSVSSYIRMLLLAEQRKVRATKKPQQESLEKEQVP